MKCCIIRETYTFVFVYGGCAGKSVSTRAVLLEHCMLIGHFIRDIILEGASWRLYLIFSYEHYMWLVRNFLPA